MSQGILALDLGVASIGWCLLESDSGPVIAMGSRVFEMAVEAKTKAPKNLKRRSARGMRKTIRRRQMRRDSLVRLLRESGLLPPAGTEWDDLFFDHAKNPYVLRARGLDEALTPYELGRALFHMCRRRGFKSNRRTQLVDLERDPEVAEILRKEEDEKLAAQAEKKGKKRGDAPPEDDDEGVVAKEVAELRQEMAATGSRTLGEHFAKLLAATDEDGCLAFDSVRRRHTERAMYEEEFDALWAAQRPHHTQLLTDGLKARIHQAIFHQRPLKVQRFTVGKCRFEPDRHRADRAHPDVQDYRIWQLLAHLSYRLPNDRTDHPLTQEQRNLLANKLQETAKMSWPGVRTALKLKGATFSHEGKSGATDVQGNTTVIRIEKAVPGLWKRLAPKEPCEDGVWRMSAQQDALITALLTIERKDALVKYLRSKWGLPVEQAYRLAVTEFEEGVAGLSLQAVRNLLPYLKQGKNYHDAVRITAERFRSEGREKKAQLYHHEYERETEVLDVLPLERLPKTRNPVVDKCLHEARKLVNAIVREYQTPEVVRIEMARDMKMNRKDKLQLEKQNKINEQLNKEAEAAVAQFAGGRQATRTDKLMYRLWKESNEECPYTYPYTGTKISLAMLYSGQVDIEHIIPYSRCLDDSMANKTLCMAEENRWVKKNMAPSEAYAGQEKYEDILRRVDAMKCSKHKKNLFRLTTDEIQALYGDFAGRHLNDTRYIATVVKDMLGALGCQVQVSKGGATAALRHKWGLDTILAPEGEGEKNRDDHRHHAVDAAVIAATSPAYLKRLSDANQRREEDEATGRRQKLGDAKWDAPPPWESFRADVEQTVHGILVSHQATRGLSGALHEETAYGWDARSQRFTVRKPVLALTDNEVDGIRDPNLRGRVQEYRATVKAARAEHKASRDRGDAPGAFVEQEMSYLDRHGKRRVVRRVKIDTAKADPAKMLSVPSRPSEALGFEPDPRATKHFPYGSNHHFVIYDDDLSDKRRIEIVTMHEAARRAVRGEPIFQATLADERYVPVMALCANDVVEFQGQPHRFYKVVEFSSPAIDSKGHRKIDCRFLPLSDAMTPRESPGCLRFTSTDHLRGIVCKVRIDRLGRAVPVAGII